MLQSHVASAPSKVGFADEHDERCLRLEPFCMLVSIVGSMGTLTCTGSEATRDTETATRAGEPTVADAGKREDVEEPAPPEGAGSDEEAQEGKPSVTEGSDSPSDETNLMSSALDPFAECDVTEGTAALDFCTYSRDCDFGKFQRVGCSLDADGTWACSCFDWNGIRNFEVSSDAPPCEAFAPKCAGLDPVTFAGDPVCAEAASSDHARCESSTTCERRVEIDDSTTAIEIGASTSSFCDANADASWRCSCITKESALEFVIAPEAVGGSGQACQLALGMCSDEPKAELADWSCTPIGTEATGGCELVRDCSRSGELEGIDVRVQDVASVRCEPTADGGATCHCQTNRSGYAILVVSGNPQDDATCEAAFELCAAGIEFSAEAEPSCNLAESMAGSEYCYANAECTRPAMAGDQEVVVGGSIQAQCRSDGTAYACRCAAGDDPPEFTLDARDLAGACSEAALLCPARVGAHYGVGILPTSSGPTEVLLLGTADDD